MFDIETSENPTIDLHVTKKASFLFFFKMMQSLGLLNQFKIYNESQVRKKSGKLMNSIQLGGKEIHNLKSGLYNVHISHLFLC